MLWILQNDFSQDWHLSPVCFYKCSLDWNKEDKERLDKYAIKVVGDEPAKYGYVKIEGEGDVSTEDNSIVFCCDTQDEQLFIYEMISEALLFHPGVIDLRGQYNIRII